MMTTSNKPRRLLFIGNSLSNCGAGVVYTAYRFPMTMYTSVAALSKKYCFCSYAIPGRQGQQIVDNWSTVASQFPLGPGDVAIIWEGINDMGAGGKTGTQAYNNLVTISNNVRATGAKSIILDVIPANLTGTYPDWETERVICNGLLNTNQSTICDRLVKLTSLSAFNAANDYLDTTYYHTDQIHLNDVGYDLVGTTVYNAIASML